MGQVWQATDTQLSRQVALKILPDAFADDPDRLARFQREAQVLASLNHPGIAAIYGIEKSDDTQALVLELIEGPTLADRIAHIPALLDQARTNLTGDARDLWMAGLRSFRFQSADLDAFAEQVAGTSGRLDSAIEAARHVNLESAPVSRINRIAPLRGHPSLRATNQVEC